MVSVLTCTDNEVKKILVSKLSPDHFAYDQMVLAFEIYQKTIKQGDHLPTMETFLQAPEMTAECAEVLRGATVAPVTNADDAKHLLSVLDYYRKARKALELAMTISAQMKAPDAVPDMDKLTLTIEKTLSHLNNTENEQRIIHIGKGHNADYLMDDLFNGKQPKLIPSCFTNFDIKVGGFGANDLVILASHMKGGKSIMALNMIKNQYLLHNLNVAIVSMEMQDIEVRDRLLACLTGIEVGKFRQKTLNKLEQRQCEEAWDRFKAHGVDNGCRFTIWDGVPGIKSSEIKLEFKNRGYDVICIDYLNLMEAAETGLPDWQRLSVIARELKQLTKELNTMILSPTQMGEDGDVRYSKAIKEHANTVWTWFFKEEQKATHLIRVDQPIVRGWEGFPFMLREDFRRSQIMDGPTVVPEREEGNSRKESLKKMYED